MHATVKVIVVAAAVMSALPIASAASRKGRPARREGVTWSDQSRLNERVAALGGADRQTATRMLSRLSAGEKKVLVRMLTGGIMPGYHKTGPLMPPGGMGKHRSPVRMMPGRHIPNNGGRMPGM